MRPEIQQVVALAKRGDQTSLEKALALLQKTAFAFSMNVCGQRQDAEDTMQEVLIQSLPYLPKFDSPKALAVWLYKVAKTRCLMSRRRSKFAPQTELSLEALAPKGEELQGLSSKPSETPEEASIKQEGLDRLREAVRRLPPEYRLVLVLRDMEDLSDEQIAKIMGLKPGTVRVRLHRARLFVRKELAQHKHPRSAPSPLKTGTSPVGVPSSGPSRCRRLFAELSDYLDDALDDSLCRELEKHLEGCAPCEAFLADLKQTISQCRGIPRATPDPHRAAKLRFDVLEKYQRVMNGAAGNSNRARKVPEGALARG
jgi:RNA polymerase sigma-70 factor, ECF subfamily